MDSTHTITKLWDLIGCEVSHVRGGSGRLAFAFDKEWYFGVSWEAGIDEHLHIVPADVLLLSGIPIRDYLQAYAPHVLEAVRSWKTFSFVSRSNNPQQFMDADWDRVIQLLRTGNFERADKAYVETCTFFMSAADYEQVASELRSKIEQKQHRDRIGLLLESRDIDSANHYFENHCRDWWDLDDFQKLVDAVYREILRLQEIELESLRRIAKKKELERQAGLRSKVEAFLRLGRFYLADKAHLECTEFWSTDTYMQVREMFREEHRGRVRTRWDARRCSRQATLKNRITSLLQVLDIESADQAYDHCKSWWSKLEYETLRDDALRLRDFVQAYPNASLLELDTLRSDVFANRISADDYACIKLPKLLLRLARLGMPLSEEQLLACACPEQHRLIRARAGSGKTRALAAHAALCIHDQSLDPDQVLILAFNTKAAHEIGDRVRDAAGIKEFRNARTFHSLAWQLADHSGRELIFNDGNLSASRQKQTGFMERLLASIMNPAFREKLYEFFRRELEQLDRLGSNLSKEEYAAFRYAMTDYTLGGENVKSNGEKFIADFLFEHGINYKYEKVWSWDKQDRHRGTPYRPDFSITDGGRDVILEHWAINPDDAFAQVPNWWNMNTQDYLDLIKAKREYWANRDVVFLETHTGMLGDGRDAFEASLQALLEHAGIRCHKLEHNELTRRIAEAPRTVSKMAELFLQFVSRAKKRGWTVERTAAILRDDPDPEPRNRAFHELALHAYAAYERQLVEQSAMDFDDLLISAAECVKKNGGAAHLHLGKSDSIAIRDLRWILIDEFQDFSELYYQLINSILEANSTIRVVAVGDDWQAINGFAGAQPTFFNHFADYFPNAGAASISTNRRSGKAVVGAGNQLMDGQGGPALAHHNFDGEIDVVKIDKIRIENESVYPDAATTIRDDGRKIINWELAKALKACVDYIVASIFTDKTRGQRWMPSVLILARTGQAYSVSLTEFGNKLEDILRHHPDLQNLANDFVLGKHSSNLDNGTVMIEVMTAHKAKGKEADTVIVLEAVSRQFPKVHADNQLFGPFGVTAEDVLADERRLFYVTATRAQHRLMLLSETDKESPYLGAMQVNRLADNRPDSNFKQLDAEAQVLKNHLDRIDRESLIRQNVSQQAIHAWDSLAKSPGLPEVGYSLSQDIYAELAWPEHKPPIAILTGRHRANAERWRRGGWVVH